MHYKQYPRRAALIALLAAISMAATAIPAVASDAEPLCVSGNLISGDTNNNKMMDPGESWTVSCLQDNSGEFSFPLPKAPTPPPSTTPPPPVDSSLTVRGVTANIGSGFLSSQSDQIERVFTKFVNTLTAKSGCLKDVTIIPDPNLESPGSYSSNKRQVTLLSLGVSDHVIVHELAHHLDASCGAGLAIGEEFKAAQGLTEVGWWYATVWELTPGEHFAETVTQIILGSREDPRGLTLSAEAIQMVRTWTGLEAPAPKPPTKVVQPPTGTTATGTSKSVNPTSTSNPANPPTPSVAAQPRRTTMATAPTRPATQFNRSLLMFLAMCRDAVSCGMPVEGKPSWTLSWQDETARVFRVNVGSGLWFD